MFLFIPQYFTGLKLHRARNLLIKAAVQCLQQGEEISTDAE